MKTRHPQIGRDFALITADLAVTERDDVARAVRTFVTRTLKLLSRSEVRLGRPPIAQKHAVPTVPLARRTRNSITSIAGRSGSSTTGAATSKKAKNCGEQCNIAA